MFPQNQNPGGKPSKDANWRSTDRECRTALASMMRLSMDEFNEKFPEKPTKKQMKKISVAQWKTAKYIRENTPEVLARFLPNVWADDREPQEELTPAEIAVLDHPELYGKNGHASA